MKPSILVFAGSSRQDSVNKRLAQQASNTAQKLGFESDFIDLKDYPMPLYNGDLEQAEGIPESAQNLETLIKKYDIVIIASPEYNGGFTALLKNTIDWTSRVDKGFLKEKTIGLMSATPGPGGGARVLALLRTWFESMRLSVAPEVFSLPKMMEAFGADGLEVGKQGELEQFISDVVKSHVAKVASEKEIEAV